MKKSHKNIIFSVIIFGVLLFLALTLCFVISLFLPGDPVLAMLPDSFTPQQYLDAKEALNLDAPLIIRYFQYIGRMLTGNWMISDSMGPDREVFELIATRLPRTIDILVVPLIVGILLGLILGKISVSARNKRVNRLIQILAVIGLALPIFVLVLLLKFLFSHILEVFPPVGYKTISFGDPPFITGFRIIDSLLSGQWYFIPDYLLHLILPWIILTITITALITVQTRSYLLNRSNNRTVVTNSLNFGFNFGMIFAFVFVVELMFNLQGAFYLILIAIGYSDYWLLNAIVFILAICFVFILLISNLLFILYGFLKQEKEKRHKKNNNSVKANNEEMEPKLDSHMKESSSTGSNEEISPKYSDLKVYILSKLKSPLTIIGLVVIGFFIIISIFPQIFTPYPYDYFIGNIYTGEFDPPSPNHPLGQTILGFDNLAVIVYGVRFSLQFGAIAILIALGGGIMIGIPMNLINRKLKVSSEILLIVLYNLPLTLIVMLWIAIFSGLYSNNAIIIGFLMIPVFAQIIAKTRFNFVELSKKLIIYIPLILGLMIIIHNILNFFGFYFPSTIQLGAFIGSASGNIFDAPWASLYPGLALFGLITGFFLIYAGLQRTPQEL